MPKLPPRWNGIARGAWFLMMVCLMAGSGGAAVPAGTNAVPTSTNAVPTSTSAVPAGAVAAQGARLLPVPLQQVTIDDPFWSPRRACWRQVTIGDCFDKFEQDRGGAIQNFDRVREHQTGGHAGPAWYDGLIYEMIRGASDFLAAHPDPALERRLDGYIARIAAAQGPDGYLNTWTQLMEPDHRWGLHGGNDVEQHDIYNLGALAEAGVHHYRATGKTSLLRVAVRMANHACDVLGPPPKASMVPGHALPEEALASLYLVFRQRPELKQQLPADVDETRWLKLAEYFIENRGHHSGRRSFGSYDQDHLPVFQQQTLEGHAVRATLLGAGLTALAGINGRQEYRDAAQRLWTNMTSRRMYLNGGVGSSREGEAFSCDYDLPNQGYLETCAAIGSGFFSRNMNLAFGDARYADELERTLYNAVLAGVSLEGNRYFYENPLEAGQNRARWSWHACPCCPPMFLKLMGGLPESIYAQDATGIYINLFIGGTVRVQLAAGDVSLRQTTRYPWEGEVTIHVEPHRTQEFDLFVRVPLWCQGTTSTDALYQVVDLPTANNFQLKVNGELLAAPEMVRGYARVHRDWQVGDRVDLQFDMAPRRVRAHPQVAADQGRVALMRGPIVYCFEGIDNGGHVRNLVLPPEARLTAAYRADLLGGVTVLETTGVRLDRRKDQGIEPSAARLVAIPYAVNANREPTELAVWLAESPERAVPLSAGNLATGGSPSASHCHANDSLAALHDGIEPSTSDDAGIPRFTWWNHRGTSEWVQYQFDRPQKLGSAEVYWWDERRIGAHCRVPASWRLVYLEDGVWKPVQATSEFGTQMDRFNRVTFAPIETTALRLEATLQPDWSGGILEWKVE